MKLSVIFILFFLLSIFLYLENEIFDLTYAFTNNFTRLLNIENVSINGSLLSDGKFLIVPDPFQKSTLLEISDNDLMDSNKTIGVISLSNISNNNYTITQKASNDNYLPNTISRLVEINNGNSTSSIIKTIDPNHSIGLTCKDIENLANLDPYDTDLVEGFVILQTNEINIAYSSNERFANEPISVQVFYTANALDSLPQETLIEKFVFQIISDSTLKIPKSLLNKNLEVLSRADLNSIVPQDYKVKKILSSNYNLTDNEIENMEIIIKETDLGVGNMIDDHAISLLRLSPE